jgi:hypothetical protein
MKLTVAIPRLRLPGPVASAGALAAVAGLAAIALTPHRVPGALVFAAPEALGLWCLTLVALGHRLLDLSSPGQRPLVARHAAQIMALLVANLLLVDVLLWTLLFFFGGRSAFFLWQGVVLQEPLGALEQVTAWLVRAVLVVGALLAASLALSRGLDGLGRRRRGTPRFRRRPAFAALATLVVAEVLYVGALTANATLARSDAVFQPTEIVRVRRLRLPFGLGPLWWADVQSWRRPGTIERIALAAGIDEIHPSRLVPSQHVLLSVQTGYFGWPRILWLRADRDAELPALIAALPSAEWPRKWRIGMLARNHRWAELVAEVHEYRRYYPEDREIVQRTLLSLKTNGQPEMARALERDTRVAAREGAAR